jgi:hypothetical protein
MPESDVSDRNGYRLLTVQEFAHLVGMHPRSIYRRIWDNKLQGVCRIGWLWRIDVTKALPFDRTE